MSSNAQCSSVLPVSLAVVLQYDFWIFWISFESNVLQWDFGVYLRAQHSSYKVGLTITTYDFNMNILF